MILQKLLKRKTVKNAGYLIAGKVIQMAFSFVIGLLTARYLGPSKHRLTRAHREKQLKMSCQALHNAPPNRT